MSSRRRFLKNSSLAAAGIAAVPAVLRAEKPKKSGEFVGCVATTQDYFGEGPFYTENAPQLEDGSLAPSDEPGTKLVISGRVQNQDCSLFLENTVIDIWHANDAGEYDNEGFHLRGRVSTNSEGFYLFETVKPGKYLNGNSFRPSHIHIKITPPESDTLTTQLYFSGDEDIPEDAAASITSGTFNASNRIITLFDDGNGGLEGVFDIVVDAETTDSIESIHLDKGLIYELFPNPFNEKLTVKYGVFKNSRVQLEILDIAGNKIASLKEEKLKADKYEADWSPEVSMADGHYFVVLKINDLQVSYKKVQKISTSNGY